MVNLYRSVFIAILMLLPAVASGQSVEGLFDDAFGPVEYGGFEVRGAVNAIARHPVTSEIFAGGGFTRAGDVDGTRYIARWTGAGWEPLGGGLSGRVEDLDFDSSGNLYVAGNFVRATQPDGTTIDLNDAAMWDGSQWHALGRGLSGSTTEIEIDPQTDDVYFGGNWTGGFDEGINQDSSIVVSPKIIRWDGSAWRPVGKGLRPGFGSGVFALAIDPDNGNVVAGGSLLGDVFNPDSSAVKSYGLALWDGTEWTSLRADGDKGYVDVLTFDPAGRLWAGGDMTIMGGVAAHGLAYWDGSTWIVDRGGRSNGKIWAVAFQGSDMYIGGNFTETVNPDGSTAARARIARWDGTAWQPLGAGLWAVNYPAAHAFLVDGVDVYIGGNFDQAGAQPSLDFGRWIAERPSWSAAYVTFRLDLRRAQRLKIPESSTQPFVNVYSGERPGLYFLYDDDGDSLWTARVARPVGVPLRYLYGLDVNGSGYDDSYPGTDQDWVLELSGEESGARSAVVSNSAPLSLPLESFDNLPLSRFRTDFVAFLNNAREAGNPDPVLQRLFEAGDYFEVTTDFESLDRTVQVASRLYLDAPGGEPPAGIEVVAGNVFYGLEVAPYGADYSARLTFAYDAITGIETPSDLRILYRSTPADPWVVQTTELDATAQTLSVADVTQLTGEWVLGSVSAANPLTADPPEVVSTPSPVDGALGVPISPTLSWDPPRHASRYALYLWPASEPEPSTPLAGSLSSPSFTIKASEALTQGVEYNWRVVASNVNGETTGPVWSFVAGAAADLIVSDVQPPTSAVAGNQISISWTVENVGSAGTRSPGWVDAVFFSKDQNLDITEDLLFGQAANPTYLGPGDRYTQTLDLELPQRVRSLNQEIVIEGSYTVFVVVDYNPHGTSAEELETDEANNAGASSFVTAVSQPVLPDLRVTNLLDPETYCPQLLCSNQGCTVIYVACDIPNPFAWDVFAGPFGVRYVFSWEGINEGDGPVRDGFQSFLFFQKDSVLNAATAIPVATAYVSSLDGGETYTATTDRLRKVDLQAQARVNGQSLPDSGYFFIATDFGNAAFEGVNESDNVFRNPERTVIRSVPPSDLETIMLSAPGSGVSGDSVEVQWTVRNNGPSYITPTYWSDAVYLSEDETFDPDSDILLDRFSYWSPSDAPVAADAVITHLEKARLPDGIEGDFYLFVMTDDEDRVNEVVNDRANRANNVSAASPISIQLAPYPDLVVTSLETPSTATSGSSILVQLEATNNGPGTTARDNSWRDRLFVSTDEVLAEDARSLTSIVHNEVTLGSGASYRRSMTARLPENLADGTYYIHAVLDADSVVYEHGGETNNQGRSAPITVAAGPKPDLVVENLSVPSTAASGAEVMVSWRVRNAGTAATDATSWADAVYLSTDPDLDTSLDERMGEFVHAGALAPQEFYDVSETLTLPEDFSGDRHLIVRTDIRGRVADSNPADNTSTTSEPTGVSLTPAGDLEVEIVNVVGTPQAGQPLALEVTVRNIGADIPAGQSWSDRWVLSSSATATSSSEVLHSETIAGPLASGASYQHQVEVILPSYASGSFYLTTEANANGGVGEAGLRTNNVDRRIIDITLPPPVDLIVENVTVPSGAQPGEIVTIAYDLTNQGTNTAEGILYDAVYLSPDPTFEPEDSRLGTQRREISLAPGASARVYASIELPRFSSAGVGVAGKQELGDITDKVPSLTPGDYRAIVWADVRNNIRETDNDNNRATSSGVLGLDVPEIFLDTPASGSVTSGQRVYFKINMEAGRDLRLTLANNAAAIRDASYEVYVAYDRSPTPDDFDHAFLAESEDSMPRVLVPETQVGTYYVLVRNPFLSGEEIGSFTLLAEAFDFTIFGVTPDAGGAGGRVVATITGAQFTATTLFYLEDGSSRIDGQVFKFFSPMEVEVRFDLRDARLGTYSLVATQSDRSVRRAGAFEVEHLRTENVQVAVSMPPTLFSNADATLRVILENQDNVDHDIVLVRIVLPADQVFRIASEDFTGAPLPTDFPSDASLPSAGVPVRVAVPTAGLSFSTQEWAMLVLYGKSMRVGETMAADILIDRLSGVVGEPFPILVSASVMSEDQFLAGLVEATIVAPQLLDEVGPGDLTTDLLDEAVEDLRRALTNMAERPRAQLRVELEQYYRDAGLLGDGEVLGPTAELTYDPANYDFVEFDSQLGKFGQANASVGGAICGAVGTFVELSVAGIALVAAGVALWEPGAALAGIIPTLKGLSVTIPILGEQVAVLAILEWVAFAGAAVAYLDAIGTAIGAANRGETFPPLPLTRIVCEPIFGSVDPNDIVGPSGYGDARWVRRDETLDYRIRFENDPELANAPARTVIITQPLDSDLDLRTLRLKRFGFGSHDFEVPGNRAFYETRLDLRDSLGIYVDMDAGLDIGARELFIRFRSIDPATGELSQKPTLGFLPPNIASPEGEGYVDYSIRALPDVPTGTRLDAKADIVFDNNAPIETPPIFNTVDADPPVTGLVASATTELDSSAVQLSWTGRRSDVGSGTQSFTLYAGIEGESMEPAARGLTDTTYVFDGTPGEWYRFFILGRDHTGNMEALKNAEVVVKVGVESSEDEEVPAEFALHQNYPNPFNPTTTIPFDLAESGSVEITLYDVLGRRVLTVDRGSLAAGRYRHSLDMSQFASGVYLFQIRVMSERSVRFRDVGKLVLVR